MMGFEEQKLWCRTYVFCGILPLVILRNTPWSSLKYLLELLNYLIFQLTIASLFDFLELFQDGTKASQEPDGWSEAHVGLLCQTEHFGWLCQTEHLAIIFSMSSLTLGQYRMARARDLHFSIQFSWSFSIISWCTTIRSPRNRTSFTTCSSSRIIQ